MRRNALIACLLASLLIASPVQAKIVRHQWPNGLTLLIEEDHAAPVAIVEIWVRAGGRDEPPGKTGLAHMLEHMMFEGTKKLAPGEFARRIESIGGRDNAFTTHDYTAYFDIIPSSRLAQTLKLEFDRFAHLTIRPEIFVRENKVVMEERRMRLEDDPNSRLFEELSSTALKLHPYRNPVIGWMQDIARLSPKDAEAFYRQHYVPANLVIVIVGDVDPAFAQRLVDASFGRLAGKAPPVRFVPEEPEPLGEKRIEVHLPAKAPVVAIGIPVPSWRPGKNDREAAALAVLTDLLAAGRSALLSRRLVDEQQLAFAVDAGYDPFSLGGDLWFAYGMLPPNEDPQAFEQAFWALVEDIKAGRIDRRQLAAIKRNAVAEEVFAQDSLYLRAMRLGRLETVGIGAERIEDWLDLIQKVRAEDVAKVARRWISKRRATVAVLVPEGEQAR